MLRLANVTRLTEGTGTKETRMWLVRKMKMET
jgi:hypothetical protein